jgi:hypothetical protein
MADLCVSTSFYEVLSLLASSSVTELTFHCHDQPALKQLEKALLHPDTLERKFGLTISSVHGMLALGNLDLFQGRLRCLSWNTSDLSTEVAAKLVQSNPQLHSVSITAPAQSELVLVASLGSSLIDLTLASAPLTDDYLFVLAHGCPLLQRIHLSGRANTIGSLDAGLTALAAGCPGLRYFEVNDIEVSDDAVTALCMHCPALEVVHLPAGYLTLNAITALNESTARWRTASISWKVSAETVLTAMQAALGGVRALVLTAVIRSCACSLMLTLQHLPSLVSLKLKPRHCLYNRPFPAQILSQLLQSCTTVRDINISHCIGDITDDTMAQMFAHCAKLRSIHCELSGMRFGEETLRTVAAQCPLLVSVKLAAGVSLTDIGVAALARSCPRLRCIYITGCVDITHVALYAIARYCKDLRTLHLHGAVHATGDEILRLLQRCVRLHTVDIPGVLMTTRGMWEAKALMRPRKRARD